MTSDGGSYYRPRARGTIQMNHSSVKQQVLPQRDVPVLEGSSIYGRVGDGVFVAFLSKMLPYYLERELPD